MLAAVRGDTHQGQITALAVMEEDVGRPVGVVDVRVEVFRAGDERDVATVGGDLRVERRAIGLLDHPVVAHELADPRGHAGLAIVDEDIMVCTAVRIDEAGQRVECDVAAIGRDRRVAAARRRPRCRRRIDTHPRDFELALHP